MNINFQSRFSAPWNTPLSAEQADMAVLYRQTGQYHVDTACDISDGVWRHVPIILS